MLRVLMHLPTASKILPYVRLAYQRQSNYLWKDDRGITHVIAQGEGGEQGDPLMPALFSLGLNAALRRIQQNLGNGEMIYAYLDDIYVT